MYFVFTATVTGKTETTICFGESEAKSVFAREILNRSNVTVEVTKRGQSEPMYRRDFVRI